MAAAEGKIRVGLFGHDASYSKTLTSAWKKADTFEKKMDVLGRSMKNAGRSMTMFATVPIVGALTLATKAAVDEEKEMALLAKALKTNAGANRESVDATEEWITATQNATGVADGELRPALAKLVAATKDTAQAQDILGQALDISAATGKPLETVTLALQKAYLGNVGGLSRLGIETKNAEGKTLSFEAVMKRAQATYGGAAATAAGTTAGKMAILKAKMADVAEEVGTILIPVVTKIVDKLSGVAGWVTNLSSGWKKFGVGVAVAVAAAGPLLMIVGQMLTMFGTLKAVIAGVSGAMRILNIVLFANPIGLVVLAIAALVGVFVLLWTKCEWFREFWQGLWVKVKEYALAFWSWAGPYIKAAAAAIWKFVQDAFDKVVEVAKWAWPYVRKIIAGQVEAAKMIVRGIGVVVGWVREHFGGVLTVTKTIWGLIVGGVRTNIALIKAAVRTIAVIVDTVRDVFNRVKDVASRIWSGVTSVVSRAVDSIVGFINKLIDGMNWVIRNVPGLKGAVNQISKFGGGGGGGRGLDTSAGGVPRLNQSRVYTPRIMDNGGMGADDSGRGGGITGMLSGATGWIRDIWEKFNIFDKLPSPVSGMFGGASGVMLGWAKDALVSLIKQFGTDGRRQQIVDSAKSMLGVPYLWGGTSPAGFDCSGLLYWAYQQAGVGGFPRIPTYGGKQIGRSGVQPADVMFYYPGAIQQGERVPFGHFKMYAGNGQTIESASGGVQMRPADWGGAAQIRTYLAKGGIVTKPTIAVLGEAGPEAVIPLSRGGAGETYIDKRTFNLVVRTEAGGRVNVPRIISEINAINGKATRASRRGRVRG